MSEFTAVPSRPAFAAIAFGSLLVIAAPSAASAATGEWEVECRAGSERTVEFESSFERWTTKGEKRREFEASLDIEDGRGFAAGQIVTFHVDGKKVASRKLVRDLDGDLEAEVEFKSWKTSARSRFPAGFPKIEKGTTVSAVSKGKTLLTCRLG